MYDYIRQVRGFRRDVRLFLLYILLANIGFGAFGLIFNLYLSELRLREDYIGAFSAVQTLSMAGTSALLGVLIGRFGIWRCITGGVMIFLGSSFGLAFATQPALLLVLAGFNGIGLAFLFTATMPFIIEWARPDQRAHVAAISFSLISLAATFGALLGGFLPGAISGPIPAIAPGSTEAFRWTLVAGTLIGSFGLVPLFLMREPRRSKPAVEPSGAREGSEVDGRRQVRRDLTIFILIGGLLSLGAGMVMPFYNVYLTTLGASARQIGYVYALAGLSAAIIGLTAPAVARRLGSLRAVLVLRLSIVPFYLLLIVAPSFWLASLAHLVRQTSISMSWPIDSTFIAEVLPGRARTTVFGLRSAAWNLGFAGASLLGGRLIVSAGYDVTFLSLIVFTALSVGVFMVYFGRHPRIRSGQIPGALPPSERRRPAPAVPPRPAEEAGGAD